MTIPLPEIPLPEIPLPEIPLPEIPLPVEGHYRLKQVEQRPPPTSSLRARPLRVSPPRAWLVGRQSLVSYSQLTSSVRRRPAAAC
jgi:hypothetical protein